MYRPAVDAGLCGLDALGHARSTLAGNAVSSNTPSPAWAGPGVLCEASADQPGVSDWLLSFIRNQPNGGVDLAID